MEDKTNQNRDAFDGGFAVVDRERLIEEETREITPWYKHFIHSITAPSKMMGENLLQEPPKGNSIAIVGSLLAIVLLLMLQNSNPIIRQNLFDVIRGQGVAENMLEQQYVVRLVVQGILAILGIFLTAFMQTLIMQFIKIGCKDRCKFSTLYTVVLLGLYSGLCVQVVDQCVGNLIGVEYLVLNASSFIDYTTLMANTKLMALTSFFSLERGVSAVYMTLGYSLVTGTSKKQAALRVGILQGIILIFSLLSA